MLTSGSKYFFGLGGLLLLAAVIYGWSSGGVDWDLLNGHLGELSFALLGTLTLGYKGAIGDHVGYIVLVASGAACLGLGGVMVAFRDNEAKSVAEVAGTTKAPSYLMPFSPNWWAPLGGFGFAALVLGLVTTRALVVAGVIVLVFVAFEWMMQAWADRATGDPQVNASLRHRIMNPIELPLVGLLVAGLIAIGFSRVLLTVSKAASVWITAGIAALIFLIAIGLALMPKAGKSLLVGVVALGAVAVLASGVVSAAQGERSFHNESEEVGHEGAKPAEAGASDEAGHSDTSGATTTAKK